jgi:hypothetical protein
MVKGTNTRPDIKVVALDPGITTGLAIGNIMVDWGLMLIDTGQAKYNHKELYDGLVRQKPASLSL